MKKIVILSALFFILFSAKSYSQINNSFPYPVSEKDSIQNIQDAYKDLETKLLSDIEWLINTPLNENREIRDEKSRFVLMWMTGSPTTSIQIDDRVVTFLDADPSVLMAYMMGWTEYSIKNEDSNDIIECSKAGVISAVKFYELNQAVFKKNNGLEEYKKMIQNNSLSYHLAKILTQP